MSAGFIPGPWSVLDGNNGLKVTAPDGDDEPWHVAHICGACGYEKDASGANASLIAAAPELYDDNQRALHFLADLNGSDWIKGNDAGARDMRQRAKELQRRLFTNAAKARGEQS